MHDLPIDPESCPWTDEYQELKRSRQEQREQQVLNEYERTEFFDYYD